MNLTSQHENLFIEIIFLVSFENLKAIILKDINFSEIGLI